MNEVDDNGFGLAQEQAELGAGRRARYRSVLKRVANVCIVTSCLALPVAVLQPNGWGPSVAFSGFVFFLLLSHLRREV